MKKNYLLLFVFFLFSSISIAQTYNMANGANGTFSTCAGTFRDGAGNYAASQNGTITFCPATPGDLIRITFTAFDTESGYDYLDMWQGNTVGATGTNDDRFMGILPTFTVTSSDPSGCLSFRFISDSGTQYAGWTATVSCITPCTPPVAALTNTAPLDICPSTALTPGTLTVPFDASGSTTSSGSVVRYEWDWGDGTSSITATPNTNHTFPGTGGLYLARLRVRNNNFATDPLGCLSSNSVTRIIRVMPEPSFTGTTTGPVNITCGSSTTLNGLAVSQTITQSTPSVISGPTALPDGSGSSYNSALDFAGLFPVGATMTAGCYPTISFDLEHSYSGDLEITLIAPSGESVMVFDQHAPTSPGHFGSCSNGADTGVAGCTATYSVVNTGGASWTSAASTTAAPPTVNGTCTYTGVCETGGSYYIPQTYTSTNSFTALNGAALNGVWTLKIKDNLSSDDGVLSNWALTFPTACYAGLQSITPDLTTAVWSGGGPAVPAQTTTSTVVNNPGPAACPAPGPCVGNQLANNVTVGPFPTPGSFVYTYTITDEFGCQYRRNVTVNVSAVCPTAAISYAGAPFCSTSGVQSVTLTGTAAYTGGTYSSTAGLTINAATGVITPSTSTPGTYTVTYTIAASACCAVAVTATTSITINTQPNAGTDGNTTVCDSSVAAINLFGLITGESAGGTWTRSSGAGGTFNAGAGTYTPASGATTSTFTYTLTGTAPCINDTSIATININAQPTAGADGNTTICDSSIAAINLFGVITGGQAGGTWTQTSGTGGTFSAAAGTYTPASGATTSTFTYTLTGTAPCINDASIATININAQPTAGADGTTTVCDSSVAAINLFALITGEQAGGVWTRTSGVGGTFNAGAGTYAPASGATTSTFTYTLTGTAPCINDSSVATITINPQPTAGADGNTTVCDSSVAAINLFSLITGEQAGGVWTQTSGTGGTFNAGAGTFTPASGATSSTFTYTLTGTAPCINDTSVASININAQPMAGADGNTAVCDNSVIAIDLFSLITGEQAGGVWTRTTGTGGTFNAGAGTFTPTTGAATSTFTYTLIGTAPCSNDTSVATITINPTLTPTINCGVSTTTSVQFTWAAVAGATGYNVTYQINASPVVIVGAIGNVLTYSVSGLTPADNVTITLTPTGGAGTCFVLNTKMCTASNCTPPTASISYGTPFCISNAVAQAVTLTGTGAYMGGTYSSTPGVTINPATGAITPNTSTVGTYIVTYTIAAAAGCSQVTATASVTINAQPIAGADGNTIICDSSVTSIDLFSLITGEQAGGVWTRTSGGGGTFNAGVGTYIPASGATTSTFTYTLTGTAPCIDDSSVATININQQPTAGADGSTTICDNSVTAIDLYSLITGEQAGGVWTRTSGTAGTFNAGAGSYTPASGATTSTFTYTLTGTAPCINDTSIATININAQPNAGGDGNTTVCDSSIAAIDLFGLIAGEQAGGVWTRTSGTGGTFNAGAGTFAPASGATTSAFTYTLTGTAPCINDTSVATININAQPIAGTDGNTTVCDSSVAAIDLFGLITGEQTGGVWTRTSGAGGTFNAGAGTYVPASGATSSTFTYTLTGTVPCINDTSVATININAQPTAGTDGNTIVCDSTVAAINLYSLITGEQAGGVWTQTSGTGGTFNAGAGTYTPASGATTGTFTYTLTGTAPCIDDSSVATININSQPVAGTDSSTVVCDSSIAVIDLFSLITGEQAGGIWTRTSGTGGTFNAGAGTYSPASGATTSTFTYTLTGTAPCIDDSSVATININSQPVAGTDGNTTVCESSVAAIDLFGLITGEQAGGAWTRTSGTGGTFSAAAGTYTPASGATTSTFTYTLTGAAPCVNDTSVATININAQPTAGTDGNTTVCDSSIAAVDLFNLITGEQTGGVWTRTSGTGGTFNAGAGTYTPASGATTSTFTYTLTGTAPCINDTSVATININAQPTAGTDGSITVCDMSVTVIDLFSLITGEQAGGVWTRTSGTGGTFNAAAGTFTPAAGSTSSTFTYTLTGTAPCINDTSVATINMTAQPTAGVSGNTTVCDSSVTAIDLFSLITGEQTGGVWTRTSGTGGIFNAAAGTYTPASGATTSTFDYSFILTPPCVNVSSTATVNINAQPIAGTDGNTTVCDSSVAAINLFSLITGEQAGGVWTRSSGTGGTFNAGAGTYTPASGATTSTFTYTLTGTAPCVNDASIATININAQPIAGTDGITTVCDSSVAAIDLFSLITGEQAGGVWSQTSGTGGVFNAGAGTFTPASGATSSTFTYTLTGTAPCINDSSVATININAQPVAGTDGITTVCDSSIAVIDLFSLITGEQAGGVWTRTSGIGGTFNAGAGIYTPASGATSSIFTYTLTGTAPCINDVSVATININAQPVSGADGTTTVCDSSIAAINLFSLITGEQAGGVWTRTSGTGGTFNAAVGTFIPASGATTSTFTYTLTGTAPCVNDSSVATININAQPTAGTDGNTTVCDSSVTSIDLFDLITGEQAGGVWTQISGTGGTFNAGAGTYTPASGATTSTFTYTLTGTAPCINDSSVATITINAQPNAGADGNVTVCDGTASAIHLSDLITGEDSGGVWAQTSGSSGTFNPMAGIFTPSSGGTSATFTYTITGTAPCIDDVSVATVNINVQPDAGTDGNTTICDSSVAVIDLFALITGEQSGGVWTRTSGTGGTFNAGTGTYTPTSGATTSSFTYTISGTAPCIDDSSVAIININAQPVAGTDGNATICDSSVSAIDLFALITGEQAGGIWIRTSGTGGTFNAGAGTYTPASGATTSTFTYTLSGTAPCINDSSVATININAQPVAGTDGATTICDSSVAVIDLFSLISGEQAGGVWIQSSGTGGTFNAVAGTYTPASGATTSIFTYTLTGTTPCIDDSSVATININAQPVAGTDSTTTVCDSSVAAIDLFTLITGEQAGGVWTRTSGTGGVFNAVAGTYTPASGATISTFTYTLSGTAPCINDSSVATININAQPVAGTDGATTVCDSSIAAIDLFSVITGEQTGGTWTPTSGTGGVFNAVAGTYTPASGATTSTFTYALSGTAPCINDSSVATININAQPVAGTDGTTTVCDSSVAAIDLFSLITGEQAGGVWTQTSGTGGVFNAAAGTYTPASGATTITFTYTLSGTAPCINDSSVAAVVINPTPTVTATPVSETLCSGGTSNIVLTSNVSGTTFTWTVVQNNVSGASVGSGNSIIQTLTATNINPGTAVYTITPTANGCIGTAITVAIIVKPVPTVTATPASEVICSMQSIGIALTSNLPGTSFAWTVSQIGATGATAGSGNNISQVLTTTGTVFGNVVYTITPTTDGCPGAPITVPVVVTPAPIATATPSSQTICSGGTTSVVLSSNLAGTTYNWNVIQTNVTGGTAGSGTVIAQTLTTIGNSAGEAVYAITPIVNGCPGTTIMVTITVNPIPVVIANPAQETICSGGTTNINLTSNVVGTTFSWAVIQSGVLGASSGSGDTIAQTLTTVTTVQGTVDYIITPITNGCPGAQITVTVTVKPTPEVFGTSSTTICSGESPNITLSPSIPGTTFTWTVVQNGVTGASDGTGDIIDQILETTGTTQGIAVYTVTPSANGCSGTPMDITVTVNPLPAPAIENGVICVDQATNVAFQTYTLDTELSNATHDFVWYFEGNIITAATGNTYEATEAGTYGVIATNTVTGCVSDLVTANVVASFPGLTITTTQTLAFSDDGVITVTVGGGNGTYEYQLDNGLFQSSNIFSNVAPGTHTVNVRDTNGCTDLTKNVLVIGYPHYFTPNGDGIHDTWNIIGLNSQPNAKIYIFDRYGKLIKQISTIGSGWDGTYNGYLLPSTDYWFTVDYFEEGVDKVFKAHFSLKR